MMCNMSMLRHRFSNERWAAALNHLPLLFCKSVYIHVVLSVSFPEQFELCFYFEYSRSYKVYNLGDKSFVTDFSTYCTDLLNFNTLTNTIMSTHGVFQLSVFKFIFLLISSVDAESSSLGDFVQNLNMFAKHKNS